MTRRQPLNRIALGVSLLAVTLAVTPIAAAHHSPPYEDGDVHVFGEMVDYPLAFPVEGTPFFNDTFYSARGGNTIHHAQDIMAPKMTPVYAAASGTVKYVNWSRDEVPPPDRCCTLALDHDDGWESWYIHLNNDSPGTDDGNGWGIAPGIVPGVWVEAGQLIGWVGDSGNAEGTSPHLHFELKDPQDIIVNPYDSLIAARTNPVATRCDGLLPTLTVVPGVPLQGTDGDDIILGTNGADVIDAGAGDDVVCGLDGKDDINGGSGHDRLFGGSGTDTIRGAKGGDHIVSGTGRDRVKAGSGGDTIVVAGTRNKIRGGPGIDRVDYSSARSTITVDLDTGVSSTGDRLFSIEHVSGAILA